MKKITPILILLLAVISMPSCIKLDLPEDVPSCIERKIKKLRRAPVQDPPATVIKWETGGEVYYYFTGDCCDQFNELYDSDCNYVCAPDGGLSGQGDGKCPTFTQPIEKTLIWRDPRK